MVLPPIKALGTVWHVELFEPYNDHAALHGVIVNWLEEFESRYSRFRPHSWLSTLNRTGEYQKPNAQFVDILTQALNYYDATDGVFNIAVGERLTQSGYDADYSFTATGESLPVPKLSNILDLEDNVISLQSGSLDLGGIGKGYAIDKLAIYLQQEHDLNFFLINGGGDIYTTSDNEKPVTVTLTHPRDNNLAIGTVDLFRSGFAASSPRLRAWQDPKTGELHNHLLTKHNAASYVVASTATEADVWATVSCIDQNVQPPPEVYRMLINESGHVVKDTFIKLKDRLNCELYTR